MDYLDYKSACDELIRQRGYLQDLHYDLIVDDGNNAFVVTQNAIAAVENAILDLDDAISAIYELGQKNTKKE